MLENTCRVTATSHNNIHPGKRHNLTLSYSGLFLPLLMTQWRLVRLLPNATK